MQLDDEWMQEHLQSAADAAFVAVAMCSEVAEEMDRQGVHSELSSKLWKIADKIDQQRRSILRAEKNIK